jgi:hypothetical protein
MIAKENLYLTADRSRVVPEGDSDAMFLFAREGEEIPGRWAERYGLTEPVDEGED